MQSFWHIGEICVTLQTWIVIIIMVKILVCGMSILLLVAIVASAIWYIKKAEYIRSIVFGRQKQLQVSTQDSINAQKSLPKAAAEGNNMFDTYSAGTKNNRDNKSTRL